MIQIFHELTVFGRGGEWWIYTYIAKIPTSPFTLSHSSIPGHHYVLSEHSLHPVSESPLWEVWPHSGLAVLPLLCTPFGWRYGAPQATSQHSVASKGNTLLSHLRYCYLCVFDTEANFIHLISLWKSSHSSLFTVAYQFKYIPPTPCLNTLTFLKTKWNLQWMTLSACFGADL